jgi:hypothetical protein
MTLKGSKLTEIEVIQTASSAITSLTTTGMLIVALTIIIFALAKFGVFGKILDREMKKRHISTGADENAMKRIFASIEDILENDRQQSGRLDSIEKVQVQRSEREIQVAGILDKLSGRLDSIEKSQFEYKLEAYKKAAFDNRLLMIDRMAAAIKFLLNGGNSETKTYFLNIFAHEDLETWNGLCKALNAMQYWQHEKKPGRRSRAVTKK